jgi:hypothetical protein
LPSTRRQSPPLNDLDFPSKSMKFVNTIGDVKLAGLPAHQPMRKARVTQVRRHPSK